MLYQVCGDEFILKIGYEDLQDQIYDTGIEDVTRKSVCQITIYMSELVTWRPGRNVSNSPDVGENDGYKLFNHLL